MIVAFDSLLLNDEIVGSRSQIIQQDRAKVVLFDQPGKKPSFRRREIYGFPKQDGIFMGLDACQDFNSVHSTQPPSDG
jgi:hypothetical protein